MLYPFTTSPAYQLALLVLFLVVVVGWWSYFDFLRWPHLAFALSRVSVVTITRPNVRMRAITVQAGRYMAISRTTRGAGLHLVTWGWLCQGKKR